MLKVSLLDVGFGSKLGRGGCISWSQAVFTVYLLGLKIFGGNDCLANTGVVTRQRH